MDVVITPEPSDAEREAILRALTLERRSADPPPPWRQAALEPESDRPAGPPDGWAQAGGRVSR